MDIKINDIVIGRLYKEGNIKCQNCNNGHFIEWNIDDYGETCSWEFKLVCEYCQGEFSITKTMMDTFIIF